MIEQRNLLSHTYGVMPRQHDHHGAELHMLGLPSHIGEELQDVRAHRIVSKMVLDRPDGIKAQWLGHLGQSQLLAVDLSVGEGGARVLQEGGITNVHGVLLVLYGGACAPAESWVRGFFVGSVFGFCCFPRFASIVPPYWR